jgi:hypothetical protein
MFPGAKLSLLIQDMDQPTLDDPETMKDRRTNVVNYFISHLRTHNSYVFKFVFCEVLNLVNILTQVTRPKMSQARIFSKSSPMGLTFERSPFCMNTMYELDV